MTEPLNPDPLDEVIAEFRRMATPDRPADDELLAQLVFRRADTAPSSSTTPRSLRRFLMRPIVRYSMAAAVLLGALGWLFVSSSSSVALADVIKAAEKYKFVRCKVKQICDDKRIGTAEGTVTVYVDLKTPRMRQEHRGPGLNGALECSSIMVRDCQQDRFLNLMTEKLVMAEKDAKDENQRRTIKFIIEKGMEDKKVARLYRAGQADTPPFSDIKKNKPFLDNLRAFQAHKDTTSTKVKLDGRDAVKYRLEEDGKTSILWVDPTTKLPVRIEYEVIDPTPHIAKNKWIYTDFDWDPEIKDVEQCFSTKVPEGFTVEDHTKDK